MDSIVFLEIVKEENNISDIELKVWTKDILLKLVSGADLQHMNCVTSKVKNKKLQLFEVLVTETITRSDNSRNWFVSQCSGDGGVDFYGEKPEIGIPNLVVIPPQIIFGQVKRRKDEIKPEDIINDIRKIYDNYLIEHGDKNLQNIFFVVSSTNIEKSIFNLDDFKTSPLLVKIFDTPQQTIQFIDANKIFQYWALYRSEIEPILKAILPKKENHLFNKYLNTFLQKDGCDLFEVHSEKVNYGVTGKELPVRLLITPNIELPETKLIVRWKKNINEQNNIEIVRPYKLPSNEGYLVSLSGIKSHKIELFVRCFAHGEIELGKIELLSIDGSLIKSIDLHKAYFNYQFNPPYFSTEKNRVIENTIESSINKIKAGGIESFAITGIGGSGKTKLCENVIDIAHKQEFRIITISHPLNKISNRHLIKEFVFSLANINKNDCSFIENIENDLHLAWGKSNQKLINALKLYIEDSNNSVNTDDIMKCLSVLLLHELEQFSIIIHLKDLHWASSEEFEILEKLVYNLKRNDSYLKRGILFLFEGRNKEALKIDEKYFTPIDWFNFLKNDFVVEKEVKSWNLNECEMFLDNLFESSLNRNLYLPSKSQPLYQELLEHILVWAKGNPMHLVEQLKLLLAKEIVKQNDKNGLLYVSKKLPEKYSAPENTYELIKQRVEFFKIKYPRYVDFFIFISKIGKQLEKAFFDYLINNYFTADIEQAKRVFLKMDFASVPIENHSSFEFSHENYYHSVKDEELCDKEKLPSIALEWYDKFETLEAKDLLEIVRINNLFKKTNHNEVLAQINKGLSVSSDDSLNEEFYKNLLAVPKKILEQNGHYRYKIFFSLADILIRIGSWTEALSLLRKIEKPDSKNLDQVEVYIRAKEEIANVTTDIQKPDIAVEVANEAIEFIDRNLKINNSTFLLWLKERLWNKLAVAYWFNGEVVRASKWQWKSYRSALERNDEIAIMRYSCELGTLFLHRYTNSGYALLQRSLALCHQIKGIHHQQENLITVQLLMGKLLNASTKKDFHSNVVNEILNESIVAHSLCMERRSIYEASLCGIICGTCSAILLKYEESKYWFKMAITTSTYANLFDILWKARLNLAQINYLLDDEIELEINAKEAQQIIIDGLKGLKYKFYKSRLQLMKLPLLHIYRIYNKPSKSLLDLLTSSDLKILDNWKNRPLFTSNASQMQQVLHLRHEISDFFMMN